MRGHWEDTNSKEHTLLEKTFGEEAPGKGLQNATKQGGRVAHGTEAGGSGTYDMVEALHGGTLEEGQKLGGELGSRVATYSGK